MSFASSTAPLFFALAAQACATSGPAKSEPATIPPTVPSALGSASPPTSSSEASPSAPSAPAASPSEVDPPLSAPFGAIPWLGVSMDNGGDLGVRVEGVVRGSPAERGGVRLGDRIVTIDGTRVTMPAQVSRMVATHKVGESVTLGLERSGSPIAASVLLGTRPSTEAMLRMHLVGAPAPEWRNVVALSGAPASVAALKGRVVILDFWASWCNPCRMIAPRLSALRDRLGAQGLSVVGITTDPPEQAAVFAQQLQMRYPSVVDKDGDTSRAYNVTALPTLVLVDKNGVVRDVVIGFGPDVVEAKVRKLLAEPGPSPSNVVPPPAVSRPTGR